MNGEVSEPDFNSTGDEAAKLANSIIENLQANTTSPDANLESTAQPDHTAADNSD
jgi:hypothetical protein